MVAGKSPDWLPPGFTERFKYKNGKKIKYYYNDATGAKYNSKKDVVSSATDGKQLHGAHKVTNGDDGGSSSNEKVEAIDNIDKSSVDVSPKMATSGHVSGKKMKSSDSKVTIETTTDSDLPPGWIKEIKITNNGNKIRRDPYYVDPVSRYVFRSKVDALKYVKTNDIGSCTCKPFKRELEDLKLIEIHTDNMDKSSGDISPKMASSGHASGKKMKSSDSEVTIETTTDSDLPPGWIKEIKIKQSGNKIRRDPYYIDPVSRYVFRSKVDALKYVKTNDIGSCTCKPFKRELEDLKLVNESHSNNVEKSTPDISPQRKSMTGTGDVSETKTRSKDLKTVNNVDNSTPDISRQRKSMTGTGDVPGKNTRSKALKTVDNVDNSTPDNPPQSKLMADTDDFPRKSTRSKALKTVNNVDNSTAGISPQSKSMAGTDDIPGKNTRSKALKMVDNVDKSCPDISPEIISMAIADYDPEKEMKSALKEVSIETTIDNDLPPGWIKEIKISKSWNRIRRDPYYTDPVSGYVFRSKLDALRYLETNDIGSCVMKPFNRESLDFLKIASSNPVDEKLSEPKKQLIEGDSNGGEASGTKSLAKSKVKGLKRKRGNKSDITEVISVGTDSIEETKAGENSSALTFKTIDNVDKSCLDISPEIVSMACADYGPEKEMKSAIKGVTIERAIDKDLPPGWIKEIKISKSWNRARRDPYYTDPVSGYVFRSKLDALRYLETNDITSCVMKPCTRESLDFPKIDTSSNPGDEKLSEPKKQLIEGAKHLNSEQPTGLSAAGSEASGTKSPAKSKVKGLKRKRGNKSDIAKVTSVGTDSIEETKATTKNELSGSRKVNSKKSKTQKSSSLPSRSSRRLASRESALPISMDSSEPPVKASDTGTKADTFSSSPLAADIEADEAAEHEVVIAKIVKEIKPLGNIVKPCAVGVSIPENRTDGVVNEKQQPDDSKKPQESQLSYDFGDAWSDPLEFAFKTLCGEIPLEDNLRFSGDLNDPLKSPFNEGEADTFLKPAANSDEPMLFHNAFVPGFESSKRHGTVGQLELNSLPSSESLKPHGALSLLQAKSSSLATIDLSLAANSSASTPSFTQHETIANLSSSSFASFKPYGGVGQFPANSSAPFNHYWAPGSQSQANLAAPSSTFKQYGSIGLMQANSSFPPPSFRPVGQWPPSNQSLFSSPSGTIGFSTLNSFNVQSSAEAGRKNSQTKFNP